MNLQFDNSELKLLIEAVVEQTIERIGSNDRRIAFSEPEAADRLGVARHVLRDMRLRGEVRARKVGKEWRYLAEDLKGIFED